MLDVKVIFGIQQRVRSNDHKGYNILIIYSNLSQANFYGYIQFISNKAKPLFLLKANTNSVNAGSIFNNIVIFYLFKI